MTDRGRGDDDDTWVRPSAQAGAGAASALVGVILGPIAGPPAAAASNPVLARTFEAVASRFIKQSRASAEAVLAGAADEMATDVDELAGRIVDDVRRLQLAGHALAAGSATVLDDKIRALGRCLAAGVTDDALVDPEQLAISALADMEAPHVNVLRQITEVRAPGHPWRWTTTSLADALPGVAPVLGPVLATLLRHALLLADPRIAKSASRLDQNRAFEVQTAMAWGAGSSSSRWTTLPPFYDVTEFGRHVLEMLRAADTTDGP